jgi:hypothetical protein
VKKNANNAGLVPTKKLTTIAEKHQDSLESRKQSKTRKKKLVDAQG